MMSVPILSTKLHIPYTRIHGVSRPRLIEKILTGVTQPGHFVLVSGPAGFGKTTLLSDFAGMSPQKPIAWLSLDEADNDPIRFWNYLIAACQTIEPGIGESGLALLQTPQPLPDETIPTLLINDLVKLEKDLIFILDDYHAIQNPSIHAALSFLIDHLPDTLHLILSTRVDPPWPLARFRARNQLTEIRAADLRFTTEEATIFLRQMMNLDVSAEDVAALEARTEGWIASLQLAALSMRNHSDISGFIKAFTGSHIYVAEYLVEEILRHQKEEVKTFLLQTSTLERLNAGLCQAVSGRQDSQALLKDLYQSNLFLISLDEEGQWYRYHHLFADLLQAHLFQDYPAESIAVLHRRAFQWYEREGMISDAIQHALTAKDYSHALQLIETNALPMILQAYVRTVEDWLKSIPQSHLEQSPRAIMAFTWLYLLRGSFAEAAPFLERLNGLFSTAETGEQDPSLLGEWLALQSKWLSAQGKPAESRDLSERALQILPEEDIHVRSMVLLNLGTAYQQQMEYDQAANIFQQIVHTAQKTGNFVFEILGTSGQAQMLLQQGRLHLGFEIASQGIRRLESTRKSTPFSATLYGELGQIHYHWHHLDEARAYLLRSIQASGLSGYSDPEIYHHIMLSRMFQMQEDWESAAQEMQKATDLARAIPPAMVREEVISQQVRIDLAFSHFAAARENLKAEGFSFDGIFGFPALAPGTPVTHPLGMLYNSALRVLLAQDVVNHSPADLKCGIELASLVLAGELQCQHLPIALATLLLRAQLHLARGDEQEGLADVAQALELAEPEGFISLFVEEGQPIAEALTIALKRDRLGKVNRSYVQEILSAFPKAPPSKPVAGTVKDVDLSPIEALTARELEVLRLIATGDSNQVIAGKLVITLSAVKKHTGNIFNKLNVNSRTQAVARARWLGLLSTER